MVIKSKKSPAARTLAHKLAVERGKLGGRKPAPEGETKTDRFTRLANERVNKILSLFPALGKLSRRDMYEYTPETVDKIEAALIEAVEREVAILRKSGKAGFSL